MNKESIELFESAEHFALATSGPYGLNVVPLSVVELIDGEIQICHFFMNKTIENLRENPQAALSAWKGLKGIQVKGAVRIVEAGGEFDAVLERMKGLHPDRTLSAVLCLTPEHLYSITPGENGQELEIFSLE